MLDNAITKFLDNKKSDFLKKKIKANTGDEEKRTLEQKANSKYTLSNWLHRASIRAKQLSATSHPAKFIHPKAKTTSIIADCSQKNDGLLRSGNVYVDLDFSGAAAASDVAKFLLIELADKKTILQHLEQNTDFIQQQFDAKNADFSKIRKNFLLIKTSDLDQTSDILKQVYFPVDGNYHLLSILIPSGIIYQLKQKINAIRFSDEKKQIDFSGKIEDIKNLTAIGYGGTKPQNISMLNIQNKGASFLLSSMPPPLSKRKTQPPKKEFFEDCLWSKLFKEEFEEFHKVLEWRKNNRDIRDKRDDIVIGSLIKVQRIVENIRGIGSGWSNRSTYKKLDMWQKIWLDEQYQSIRKDDKQNQQYTEKAQRYFSNWFIGYYKKSIDENKNLGDEDIDHIKTILSQEKELLK